METPKQIMVGAGAFVIALVLVSLLADILFPILPCGPHTKDYTGPIGIGFFLVVWWIAYVAIIRRGRRKRQEDQKP
jgi:predicted secreted protein